MGFTWNEKREKEKLDKRMNISSVEKEKYESPGHELFNPNKIMQYV